MKRILLACAVVAGLASALVATSTASAPPAPTGVHGFVHRVDEPLADVHTYADVPAFAWTAVPGATGYELQLGTSAGFAEATVLKTVRTDVPAASVQVSLPWMTGDPYALWVHVRALGSDGVSTWSEPFGFNTQWQQVPSQLTAPAGLVRWTPVAGATSYEVIFYGVPGGFNVKFPTLTNVADEREFWTLHASAAASIRWRVRAVRTTTDAALANGVPVTQYGPYSPPFTTPNPSTAFSATPLAGIATTSNISATPTHPIAHALTPGFAWSGSLGADGSSGDGLWRVYVFSDRQCVNQVLAGSIVGGPAWAPRNEDPLALPGTLKDLAGVRSGTKFLGKGFPTGIMADGTAVTPAEATPLGTAGAATGSAPTGSGSPPTGSAPAPSGSSPSGSASGTVSLRAVSLPDNGWPQGRYWWTVVPVAIVDTNNDAKTRGADGDPLEYHDTELPQDACAAGHVWPFGIQSVPVTTTGDVPYASGIVGKRVVAAAAVQPSFDQLPLVTWDPAIGATRYEVQVSRRLYPWKAARRLSSLVTSSLLPLAKTDVGTWYYRVRGINTDLPNPAQAMSWSRPVAIRITGDRFVILK